MPENNEELEKLQERVKKLARDKSYLQLIIHMTSRLGAISTLQNIVLAIPQIILDNIGGTNIKLYYFIDNEIYYADALGDSSQMVSIDDKAVSDAKNAKRSAFIEHDFSDTMMTTPEFEKAWDWVYPLTVGVDTIGVLKMENLHIGVDEWSEYLPTFFGYAALLLKNEILGYTKLQQAYNELAAEIEVRKQTEDELEILNEQLSVANEELEQEVAIRIETEDELQAANESLIELTSELEAKVDERTKELNETNEKLQAATEIAKVVYWEYDIKSDLFTFNDRFYEVMHNSTAAKEGGYQISSAEYIKRYVHPDDVFIIPVEVKKALESQEKEYTSFVEIRVLRGGEIVYASANFRLLYDDNGDAQKAIGASQDITEQKLAQLEIERTSSEWVQAMDAFGDMIYLLDTKRHLIRANKKFYAAMGIDEKQALGAVISELTHPNLDPQGCPICSAQMAFEDKNMILEADDVHNPTTLPLEITIKTIKNELQEPVAVITSLHDLSHTRRIEQELRVLNESLEIRVHEELIKNREKDLLLIRQSRLAAMGEMITNIAHQWRQPLNALAITIQDTKYAFEENELNEPYIDKMVTDSMRLINYMSHTIDDFRSFFRPDREKERFRVAEACELAAHVIADSLKNNFIGFETNYKDDELYLMGYPHEFSQVILNLLSNAKDALLERKTKKPSILLEISKYNENIKIIVQDNGGGVDADVLERAFEPYFTTKEQGKGTGLGLYMSKMIVEQHMEGKIYAYNTDDGACFVVELPSA